MGQSKRQWILLGILGALIAATGVVYLRGQGATFMASETAGTEATGMTVLTKVPDLTFFLRPDVILLDENTVSAYAEQFPAIVTQGSMPVAPLNTNAVDMHVGGAILLTWQMPTFDPSIAEAVVYRSETSGELGEVIARVKPATAIALMDSYVDRATADNALVDGQTYYYTVRSVNAGGVESANTAQVPAIATDTTAPERPSGIVLANQQDSTLKISWSIPEDDTSSLDIYRSLLSSSIGELHLADVDPYVGEVVDTVITPEVVYYYTLVAKDAAGNASPSLLYASQGRSNPFEPFAI